MCKFSLFYHCWYENSVRPVSVEREELNRLNCLSDSAGADACVAVQVYGEYKASLAFDLVSSRQKNVSETVLQTHTHRISSVYNINDIILMG